MIYALVGNPNCGKTTVFNKLTHSLLYVGNRPGVTVEKNSAKVCEGLELVDLPGIYSLTPYSDDERVSIDFLENTPPDCIVNVIDASNLERSLYLTTQLAELDIPMIIMLNMTDRLKKHGGKINISALSGLFSCPVITDFEEIPSVRGKCPKLLGKTKGYELIDEYISLFYVPPRQDRITQRLDFFITHPIFGIPIFFLVIFAVYYISVSLVGSSAVGITDKLILTKLKDFVTLILSGVNPVLLDLIVNGIINGVGSVLCFAPQMTVLFFFLVFLEDCGYMSRVAFLTDKIMSWFGLSGKCAVPMLIASGCSAPAIMSSRAVENTLDRRIIASTVSFIPCSAKLPLITAISQMALGEAWWFAPTVYLCAIFAVALSSLILKQKCDKSPFILELPPYQLPSFENLWLHTKSRVLDFLKKAGTVIFLASIMLWFLSSFRFSQGRIIFSKSQCLLSVLGNAIAPVLAPLGFGSWQAAVSVLSGFVAKESVISTSKILFDDGIYSMLGSVPSACSFLAFNLLNPPCVAAMSAMHRILGKKDFFKAIIYQLLFAYAVSVIIYHLLA